MNRKFFRSIAVIAVGSVLSVTGAGVATAEAVDKAPGSALQAASTAAAKIAQHRADLVSAIDQSDVSAVLTTADELDVTLNQLTGGQQYAIQAESEALAETASTQNTELREELSKARMASIPDPLGMLTGLLTALLDTLTSLLDSLLGGTPGLPGVPELPVPDLPVPDLPEPGVPDLPEPGVPDVPEPGVPDVPDVPEVPEPGPAPLPVPEP